MKKIILTLTIIINTLLFSSCNDSFMERIPQDSLTESTVFSNYGTFKTYAWSLYSVFTNSNISRRPGSNGYGSALAYQPDIDAGYLMRRNNSGNPFAFQTITDVSTGNGWNFSYIRRVNLLLDNVDSSSMTDIEKAHWRSVGYFFRSYYYMELISRFGDVPWIEHVLGDSDTEIAYGTRTPRKEVADNVLDNLIYAEANINVAGDGDNTINKDVVRALISRFSLFEGTWRKYHNLGDYDKYLKACAKYSELLMASYPRVHSSFGEMLTSDLGNIPGVILFYEFVPTIMTNYVLTHVERTSTHNVEMPQHILDMYLCQDGKPTSTSPLYEWGVTDKTMYSTFRNRDYRLLETVAPPYKVTRLNNNLSWEYTSDPAHREYMDIMGVTTYTGYGGGPGEAGKHKVFPLMNWSASVLQGIPHFSTNNWGQGFLVARSGNYVYRYYNVWDDSRESAGTTDQPLFTIDEVLLNYAEVKYELGEFTQTVADNTINKLRPRAKVANMIVSEITDNFDTKRDPAVPAVLWEIRRERMVELMGQGFGFYDVRRWKRAEWFINHQHYGQWAKKSDIGNNGQIVDLETGFADATGATEGYVFMYNNPVKAGLGWLDKYYLYQIPKNEIALNPNLTQNPGWDSGNNE